VNLAMLGRAHEMLTSRLRGGDWIGNSLALLKVSNFWVLFVITEDYIRLMGKATNKRKKSRPN